MDIRKVRKAANLTQNDLAQQIGVNRATLSKYENGQIEPSLSQLRKICTVLNCHLSDLMTHEEMNHMLGRMVSVDIPAFSDKLYQSFLASEGKKISGSYVSDQQRLLSAFHRLNDKGQQEAVRSVEIIAGNPIYQRTTPAEATETPSEPFADNGQGKSSTKQEKPSEG